MTTAAGAHPTQSGGVADPDRGSAHTTRRRLSGRFTVDLPPDKAFHLFTPRGEQEWAAGWRPSFPVPTPDDGAPGTVFETRAHGEATTWVVVEREPGRRIRYARVVPGWTAGTVTVTVAPAGDGDSAGDPVGRCEVGVAYDLTALSPSAAAHLAEFAGGYAAYLRSWREAIAALPAGW